ncbi:hypothetical protein Cpha266_1200 [Chlorobium phaeobacteroides DSM 266]|uniref:Uncharacterized protein n=1 Tax=Chlorobium phaeobacteroides (strain DSM 266 / SMG 266 / 2430) TaxID=290317 RepID=A1BFQ9_CHLPD|nr:hypothetical protein Cpha266_1200 [Chlorobium phaeobacteroides DSM 266]
MGKLPLFIRVFSAMAQRPRGTYVQGKEQKRREISPDGRDDKRGGVRADKKGCTVSQAHKFDLNPKTRLDSWIARWRNSKTALILSSRTAPFCHPERPILSSRTPPFCHPERREGSRGVGKS